MKQKNPTSHSFYSQRLRLHYLDWGNVTAPTMVLVHGVQDHCRTWDWYAREFLDDYHIIAPDMRGHGDSEWARGSSYHQIDYVYDLAQLIRQARLAPTILVAHSMGGTLAALYAGVYPEAVSALVIIEGVGLWPGRFEGAPAHERVRGWIDNNRHLAGRQPRRYPKLEEAYERMHQANAHLSQEQARHLTIHGSHQNEDGSYSWKYDNYTHAYAAYGIPEEEVVALWERITCPVLIINASEGFPHRIGQNGTVRHFANVRLVDIPQAGHWAHHDRLDEVVKLSVELLADLHTP